MEAAESLPGRRARRKQEIRNRIQNAAYILFRDQGIKETSIEQICGAAEVARRTFYAYYPDKQALLRELSHSRVLSTAEGMIERIMNRHDDTRARLSGIIDFIVGNIANYTEIDRKLILVSPASFEDENHLREISFNIQDHFREIFKLGVENGDLDGRFSPEILSEMVMGTFNNMMVSWALNPDFPIFEKLEEARDLFQHILSKSSVADL